MLLTGASGVGKTFFAELMHCFACKHTIGSPPPLVYFNCAEYAHNPELLSSHLFGHHKGAFTGASENKTGLVEQADGGYLLLDEVHRLPYEGQEKLFLFSIKVNTAHLVQVGQHIQFRCALFAPLQSRSTRHYCVPSSGVSRYVLTYRVFASVRSRSSSN